MHFLFLDFSPQLTFLFFIFSSVLCGLGGERFLVAYYLRSCSFLTHAFSRSINISLSVLCLRVKSHVQFPIGWIMVGIFYDMLSSLLSLVGEHFTPMASCEAGSSNATRF